MTADNRMEVAVGTEHADQMFMPTGKHRTAAGVLACCLLKIFDAYYLNAIRPFENRDNEIEYMLKKN
jgi:hypothetical protein